jgi:hypothetical protein
METSDIVTAIIASYAAVLATITLYLEIKKKGWMVIVTYGQGREAGETRHFIKMNAVNLGQRPVALNEFWIQILTTKFYIFSRVSGGVFSEGFVIRYDPVFPIDLEPGKSCSIVLDEGKIIDWLARLATTRIMEIKGAFKDQAGRQYKSPKLYVNLEEKEIQGRLLS